MERNNQRMGIYMAVNSSVIWGAVQAGQRVFLPVYSTREIKIEQHGVITIAAVAGGGSGACGESATGGGSGACGVMSFVVMPGDVLRIEIGAGGAGAKFTVSPSFGNAGGATVIYKNGVRIAYLPGGEPGRGLRQAGVVAGSGATAEPEGDFILKAKGAGSGGINYARIACTGGAAVDVMFTGKTASASVDTSGSYNILGGAGVGGVNASTPLYGGGAGENGNDIFGKPFGVTLPGGLPNSIFGLDHFGAGGNAANVNGEHGGGGAGFTNNATTAATAGAGGSFAGGGAGYSTTSGGITGGSGGIGGGGGGGIGANMSIITSGAGGNGWAAVYFSADV